MVSTVAVVLDDLYAYVTSLTFSSDVVGGPWTRLTWLT